MISCPSVNAGNDTILQGPGCALLTATPLAAAQTTTYSVSTIPYNPYPYNGGTPILINIDDTYSGALPLGFNFCFYGVTYSQCIVGSNGVLSFDVGLANGYCPWSIGNAIPSPANPTNCIMAPWLDIDPSVGGNVRYATYGTAPCRTFVVSFEAVPMYFTACNNRIVTSQIVLYETTNIIETYIGNKPACTQWNGGYAIHGIQNATGTAATVVPGRNYPSTWTTSNDAWRFLPAGPPNYSIQWFEVGNPVPIGNTLSINACPTTCETDFYAEVTYTNCDASTILVTDTVNVAIQQQILPNATLTNVSCNGAADGSIALSPSGGQAPYSYLWTPGNLVTSSITNLGPGNYTVTITDDLGCDTTLSYTITEPPAMVASTVIVDASCNGASDGSITVTNVLGGSAPYQYSLNAGPFQAGNSFTGLPAGTYTITVRDANNCTLVLTNLVINEPAPMNVTTAVVDVTCNGGSDGSITVTSVSGGSAPYQYSLNAGPFQAGNSFTGLPAGTYSITVRDQNNCTVTVLNIVVAEPPAMTATPVIVDASCNGTSDGSITISNVLGGTGPYQYSLNAGPFQAGSSFTGLPAGTYTVTVRDANSCTLVLANLIIGEPAVITATPVIVDASCNGGSDGSITINNVLGGTGPYQYSLNAGPFQAGNSFTGLPAGTYTVTVRDANNCTLVLANLVIGEPAVITATPVIVDASCNGASDGSITLSNVLGGTGPYQYSLNAGPFQAGNSFTGLPAGTYTVTVRDANNCTLVLANLVVGEPSPIAATANLTDASCNGAADGQIDILNVSGGSPPYQYSLNAGPFQGSATFAGLTAGTYTVTVRDANNCTLVLSNLVLTEPTAIAATDSTVTASCIPGMDGEIWILNATGGTPPYQYSLNAGPFQVGNSFTGLNSGSHNVVVQDANGCQFALQPVVPSPGNVTATAMVIDATCNGGTDGQVTANPTSGTAPFQFSLNAGPFQAGATFTGLAAGAYALTVRDASGCTTTLNLVVGEPAAITATPVMVDASCNGASDGSIDITNAAGGTGPYQYSLNAGPFQAGTTFGSLPAGTYTVTIRDANNCTTVLANLVVGEPNPIAATANLSDASCNGATDGQIDIVNVSGGTPPYQYSLNAGPFQAGATFTGLAAGTYTVTVRDANNCTLTLNNLVINEPAAITATPVIADASCNGASDGSIDITNAAGGTGPYQYSLNAGPFQAGTTFGGLAAGTYTVTVRDANNCTAVLANLVVGEPGPIAATANLGNASCNGATDGQIDIVNLSGGTPPYQYSLNAGPFQAGATFTGLAAGTYTVTVRDANNCTLVLSNLLLTEPSAITATDSMVTATCTPGMDGEIWILNAAGGTPPYQYSLNAGPFQAANSFTGLNGGSYNVVVEDANGCQFALQPVVPSPGNVTATATVIDATCNGAVDGQVTANPTSGNAPFQFSLNAGPYQAGAAFSGLAAGAYTLTVRDASGCTTTLNLNVGEPAAITATPVIADVSCNGASDGSIDITNAAGGTPPYQYSLNAGPFQASGTFSNLGPGGYLVVVMDANGCLDSLPLQNVAEPAAISATDSMVTATCQPGNDGEIWILNAAGGTPPYQYSLNAGPFQAGNSFTGLSGGSYNVLVQDANGCTVALQPVVPTPGSVTATDSVVQVTCNGAADGEIHVTASSANPPLVFSLNSGPFQPGNSFSGLGGGSYTVDVRDSLGCTFTLNVVVSEPASLTAQESVFNLSCNGAADGEIKVIAVAGGTPPYQYSLNGSPFQTSDTFTGLSGGSYTYQVQDSNGCTFSSGAIQVNEPQAIVVTEAVTDVSCNGGSDGTWTLANVSGGTGPFEISLDGVTFVSGTTFSNLAAGNYTVWVRDANGCLASVNATVNEPPALASTAFESPATCGNADGSASVTVTGGTPGYTYLWSNGATTASVNGIPAGVYSVVVTDANGCLDSATVSVSELMAPVASILGSGDISCAGGSDGFAAAGASGGSGVYSFQWNTPLPVNADSLAGVPAGTYVVTVTDSAGCSDSISVTLSEPLPLVIDLSGVDPTCNGGEDGSATALVSGGTPAYDFLWSTNPQQTGSTANLLGAGSYAVTVTDANGCLDSAALSLNDPPLVVAGFSANPAMPAQIELVDANVSFSNQSQNADFYTWDFGDGASSSDIDPTHTYLDAGDFCVTLIASDSAGCTDTAEVCNYLIVITQFVIPNTFTPNGDGRNDVFEVLGLSQFPNNRLKVFNRWGNLVYEKEQYANTWDGSNFKSGDPLPDGAYFYIFSTGENHPETGEAVEFMGDIVIFR